MTDLNAEALQPFERYPDLTGHIQRMASTGHTGSGFEWSDFLGALNAAIRASAARAAADKARIERLEAAVEVAQPYVKAAYDNAVDEVAVSIRADLSLITAALPSEEKSL